MQCIRDVMENTQLTTARFIFFYINHVLHYLPIIYVYLIIA